MIALLGEAGTNLNMNRLSRRMLKSALMLVSIFGGVGLPEYLYGQSASIVVEEQIGVAGFHHLSPSIVFYEQGVRISCNAFSNVEASNAFPFVTDVLFSNSEIKTFNIFERLNKYKYIKELDGKLAEIISFKIGKNEAVLTRDKAGRQSLILVGEGTEDDIEKKVTNSQKVFKVFKVIESKGEALLFGKINNKPHLTLLDKTGEIKWEKSIGNEDSLDVPIDALFAHDENILIVSNSGTMTGIFVGDSNVVITLLQRDGTIVKDVKFPGWYGDIYSNAEGYGFVYTETSEDAPEMKTVYLKKFDSGLVEKFKVTLLSDKLASTPFKATGVGDLQFVAGIGSSGLNCFLIDQAGKLVSKGPGSRGERYTQCLDVFPIGEKNVLLLGNSLDMKSTSRVSTKFGLVLFNIN